MQANSAFRATGACQPLAAVRDSQQLFSAGPAETSVGTRTVAARKPTSELDDRMSHEFPDLWRDTKDGHINQQKPAFSKPVGHIRLSRGTHKTASERGLGHKRV